MTKLYNRCSSPKLENKIRKHLRKNHMKYRAIKCGTATMTDCIVWEIFADESQMNVVYEIDEMI